MATSRARRSSPTVAWSNGSQAADAACAAHLELSRCDQSRRRRRRTLSPVLQRPRAPAWTAVRRRLSGRDRESACATAGACCRCTGSPRAAPARRWKIRARSAPGVIRASYGPHAPGFARAMRAPTHSPQVYISGTAAIVGHASHHGEDFAAQLDETLTNLDSLLTAAQVEPGARFGARCLFKAYVRRDAGCCRLHARYCRRVCRRIPRCCCCAGISAAANCWSRSTAFRAFDVADLAGSRMRAQQRDACRSPATKSTRPAPRCTMR